LRNGGSQAHKRLRTCLTTDWLRPASDSTTAISDRGVQALSPVDAAQWIEYSYYLPFETIHLSHIYISGSDTKPAQNQRQGSPQLLCPNDLPVNFPATLPATVPATSRHRSKLSSNQTHHGMGCWIQADECGDYREIFAQGLYPLGSPPLSRPT